MSEIIPFDFEDQAVRIVMRDDSPWFVAADVCRVLEIGNPRDAVSRLDDDERDSVGITDAIGRERPTNIISESGLYALILTSRKEAARRFRKWITAEVLPAIRATGQYRLPEVEHVEPALPGGGTIREAELWLSMVREARLLRGAAAGIAIWDRSPLPPLSPVQSLRPVDPAEGRACLDHLLAAAGDTIARGDDAALARSGLRHLPDGLFVANGDHPLFRGTRWGGGGQRAALLALPGTRLDGPRTLSGRAARGVIIPEALVMEGGNV